MKNFNVWITEVAGVDGGLTPPLQRPDTIDGAHPTFHDKSEADPRNYQGKLPPVQKKPMKKYMKSFKEFLEKYGI